MPPFEILDHTADYAIRARGRDLAQLIESAGRGLIALTVDTSGLHATQTRVFTVTHPSPEDLLVRALRELLYLIEDESLVPIDFTVTGCKDAILTAQASCIPLQDALPQLLGQVKAVTYHNLKVRQVGENLEVEIVFDT